MRFQSRQRLTEDSETNEMNPCLPNRTLRWCCAVYYVVLSVVLLIYSPCLAGPVLTIDADQQYQFAETYFSSGEYSSAVDEFKRFVYFFPDDHRANDARFHIGKSHMNLGEFETAIDVFQDLIRRSPGKDLFIRSYWRVSECDVKLHRNEAAIKSLEHLISVLEDPAVRDEAYYRIGWIHMDQAAFDKARDTFNTIGPFGLTRFHMDRLFSELDKTSLIPSKSPGAAGVLSILPGAGYLYCERYRDALVAFLVNGALLYATYAAAKNDNPALAGILAFAELGFYSANIYGAVTSAHKYNQKQTRDFIERLKQNTKIQLSADRSFKGVFFSIRYSF